MAEVRADRRDSVSGRYCVIIPAFESAKTLGELIRRIRARGFPVIVVDDGSCDRTAAVASAGGALVISHLRNQGKGRALRTGFEHALRERYDGVITMDSDGQHDPDEIVQLIHAGERQHAGIVVGNRMRNGDGMPAVRRWTNEVMSGIVSLLAGQRIPDSQCGFRFIHRSVLEHLTLRTERYEIETEMLLRAASRRWKIISVPIRSIYQPDHRSHIRPVSDAVRFLTVILRCLLRR